MPSSKVHMKDGSEEPPDNMYFVVAANGTFLRKRNNWVDAVVPVKTIDGLQPQETKATLLLPRIKSTTFAKAVLFFHAVYKRQGTEAAVLLHFSETAGWELTVPTQEATASRVVDYKLNERLPGYRCVGTMHSHGSMSAFHSSTDTHDEALQDGVHITVGRLDKFPLFGLDGEFVVNGTRFPLAYDHVIFLRQLKSTAGFREGTGLYSMPFGILRDWKVPREWLDRVKPVDHRRVRRDSSQSSLFDGFDGSRLVRQEKS